MTTSILILALMAILAVPIVLGKKRTRSEFEEFIEGRKAYSEAEFIQEIQRIGLNEKIAIDFVERLNRDIQDHGISRRVIYPKLSDDRYKDWGLDDDIEEVVNDVFHSNGINQEIKWNDKDVVKLRTIGEVLEFIGSRANGKK